MDSCLPATSAHPAWRTIRSIRDMWMDSGSNGLGPSHEDRNGHASQPRPSLLSERTIGQIPCGLFLLTAAFEGDRSGALTAWVQRCSITPPLLMVALRTGHAVEPLIRDARGFALCQISADDRFLIKKFTTPPDRGEDPFVTLPTRCAPSGAPVVTRAMSFLDCEVVRHVDMESDHRLYVVEVKAAETMHSCRPAVFTASNTNPVWLQYPPTR